MKQVIKKLSFTSVFVSMFMLAFGGVASAHVVVKPAEVSPASFQIFTVSVPNEKDIPTTEIKLLIPDSLQYVTPTQKAGWSISTQREGSGDNAVVKSITWSGGSIGVGLRDEFTFSAKTPNDSTDLKWKAYQKYADGTVVSWDQEGEGSEEHQDNSGPLSVTKVLADDTMDETDKKTNKSIADVRSSVNRAIYVSTVAIVLGLIGVYASTRKK